MEETEEVEEKSPIVTTYKSEQIELLNGMYKSLTALYTFELRLVLYRLLQRGKVGITDISNAWGITPKRVRVIMDKFREEFGELGQ